MLNGQRFQKTAKDDGEEDEAELGRMVDFTRIPKTAIEVCSFQHAVDILQGTWIASQ